MRRCRWWSTVDREGGTGRRELVGESLYAPRPGYQVMQVERRASSSGCWRRRRRSGSRSQGWRMFVCVGFVGFGRQGYWQGCER